MDNILIVELLPDPCIPCNGDFEVQHLQQLLSHKREEMTTTDRRWRRIALPVLIVILAVLCRRMITTLRQEAFPLPSDMLAY